MSGYVLGPPPTHPPSVPVSGLTGTYAACCSLAICSQGCEVRLFPWRWALDWRLQHKHLLLRFHFYLCSGMGLGEGRAAGRAGDRLEGVFPSTSTFPSSALQPARPPHPSTLTPHPHPRRACTGEAGESGSQAPGLTQGPSRRPQEVSDIPNLSHPAPRPWRDICPTPCCLELG